MVGACIREELGRYLYFEEDVEARAWGITQA